ncbi:hypothetical protein [Cohnella silvisoli]|uniref:Arc family DNA-binding protein n=1 Tax=Cohnella silvisoli TaxID=2873699 RepID=A0ABV1L278_9BACL|nr:hypothetical protein [Cohnella silvisoli]
MRGRYIHERRKHIAADKKAFPLRLDPDIYRALEQWANDEFRSVNGHLEYLIREALKQADRLPKKT